jgi:uncharacterized RDD family membrane protein YckC/Tfp pilus assembly major pilin PilA
VLIDYMVIGAGSFVAFLVMGVVIAVAARASPAAGIASALLVPVFWLIVPWLYFAFMESSSQQATLGKLAVGVMVTDLAGQRIGFGRATGRYWGKFVSALILYIGYIMAAFTARKQALHDVMADTLVVHRATPGTTNAGDSGALPGWAIALIIAGCFVPVAGILAAIAIPAYADYTIRAQVTQGLNLAAGVKAEVADRLAGTQGPIAATLAGIRIDPVSDTYVASLALESGAIVILYGNQARPGLKGETLALTPARDGAGQLVWICGRHRPEPGLDLGNPDPASLTSLAPKYMPSACRA